MTNPCSLDHLPTKKDTFIIDISDLDLEIVYGDPIKPDARSLADLHAEAVLMVRQALNKMRENFSRHLCRPISFDIEPTCSPDPLTPCSLFTEGDPQ
jgi:hypothetical protein